MSQYVVRKRCIFGTRQEPTRGTHGENHFHRSWRTDGETGRQRQTASAMSLAEAVTKAGKYRNEVRDGADPAQTRYDEKHALTFEKLSTRWLERHAKQSRKSWRECERMLNKEVLKALGGKKAEAVSKKDVIACADAVLDRGAPVLANRVLSLIRSIYAWGMSEDLVERNPAAGVRKRAAE